MNRRRVLDAALALVDREGVEKLTIRRLGEEAGVEAMSLYNHVDSKDDVLDGLVGLLWEEVEESAGQEARSWQDLARALAGSIRSVAHAHPNAYPLVLTRGQLPGQVIRLGARLQRALSEAGFDDLAPYATLALSSHATSQAMAEVSWYGARNANEVPGQIEQWPPLVASEDQLPAHDPDTAFELSLELMIEALEQRIES
ncbi:MAG: TetR family transcriptional regulator [Actinomycetota bacterium]